MVETTDCLTAEKTVVDWAGQWAVSTAACLAELWVVPKADVKVENSVGAKVVLWAAVTAVLKVAYLAYLKVVKRAVLWAA